MAGTLFANVRIIDGLGAEPFTGHVFVEQPHQERRPRSTGGDGHCQRQSAPSNPPANSQENRIIDGVFTQPGPKDGVIGRRF
jgi:hypothetical protein